jgi:hypothetical protein
MTDSQVRADLCASDVEQRHGQANCQQNMPIRPEEQQRRQIGGGIDDLGRHRGPKEIQSKQRTNMKIRKLPVPGPKNPS